MAFDDIFFSSINYIKQYYKNRHHKNFKLNFLITHYKHLITSGIITVKSAGGNKLNGSCVKSTVEASELGATYVQS